MEITLSDIGISGIGQWGQQSQNQELFWKISPDYADKNKKHPSW